MWRANIKNRAFDWMGEEFARLIDRNHFLGRSAFDIPYRKKPPVNIIRVGKLYEMESYGARFHQRRIRDHCRKMIF